MSNDIRFVAHSFKVMYYAVLLALNVKLPIKTIFEIAVAALFHDIGKFKLDYNILYKIEKLTDVEVHYIKRHAKLGEEFLKKLNFSESICRMVLQHHENVDGTGYPYGLRGSEVSKGARIIRVADVYSSLTANRVYRDKYSKKEAINLMLDEVEHFDIEVVNKLLSIKHEKYIVYIKNNEETGKIY